MMRHGSLFSAIGGFDLAAEAIGWENVFHCEKDKFCNKILQCYWPNADSYEDIKDFDGGKYKGHIDIISGGFPCQPFSVAGQRRGKADDRYLFPEALRVIKTIRPSWIVLENVAGIFTVLEPDSLSEVEHKAIELFVRAETSESTAPLSASENEFSEQLLMKSGQQDMYCPNLPTER